MDIVNLLSPEPSTCSSVQVVEDIAPAGCTLPTVIDIDDSSSSSCLHSSTRPDPSCPAKRTTSSSLFSAVSSPPIQLSVNPATSSRTIQTANLSITSSGTRHATPVGTHPTEAVSPTGFMPTDHFKQRKGLFQISKNMSVETILTPRRLQKLFATSPKGTATILSVAETGRFACVKLPGVTHEQLAHRLASIIPYSGRKKDVGSSSVMFKDCSVEVRRLRVDCTGVKSCDASRSMNSLPHSGDQGDKPPHYLTINPV